jgi:uncharacterized protein (DUF2062 family)
MPRRFFRRFALKREYIRSQRWLVPFEHLLHDPDLWGIRRRNVVPAFSLGLFVAYLPFPGHMVIASLLALALRVNIPVAAASVWACNPLTLGPMYYSAFEVGRKLLRMGPAPFEFEMSFSWLLDGFIYVWQPLILGSVLLGAVLSLIGFIALDLLWRASISGYLARRRKRRQSREEQ